MTISAAVASALSLAAGKRALATLLAALGLFLTGWQVVAFLAAA